MGDLQPKYSAVSKDPVSKHAQYQAKSSKQSGDPIIGQLQVGDSHRVGHLWEIQTCFIPKSGS